MPNLVLPILKGSDAVKYKERIKKAIPRNDHFLPLMTIYLTENTNKNELRESYQRKQVFAAKLYPAGATTNSDSGVKDIKRIMPILETMAEIGMPLLIHGEVTDKEINAVKKLSKDIEKLKKDYFKIAKIGDKTLKDTKFNKKYESILKAQQEILSLIGELSNQKMMQGEEVVEEEVILEASMGDMIKKVFNTKSETEAMGIAKLLNMTDVKVALGMQKQNPKGFTKTTFAMGADNKNKDMIKDKDLMKMFKKAGVDPLPEGVVIESEESVEKTTEKLVERNMLGRLAKQLKLNEEGKQKMFDYFEKGEYQQ